MQFFTYLLGGQARAARRVGTFGIDLELAAADLRPGGRRVPGSLLELFTSPGALETAREATNRVLAQSAETWAAFQQCGLVFDFERAELLAPVPAPGKVICAAGNYPLAVGAERPEYPTIFLKPTGGVTGHGQPVVLPAIVENAAYEVELAVVIGKTAHNLPPEEALACVAGYCIGNDIGDRVLEKRSSQWTSGKMFDTFTPLGPVLVTPDELGDPGCLRMETRVNGRVVQRGSTAEMYFGPAQLVSILSELTTLRPGDVILTGSPKLMAGQPAPVVSLRPGDRVDVSIEKIGILSNPVIAESQAAA